MTSRNERFDADLGRFAAQFPSIHRPGDCVACVRQMVAHLRYVLDDDGQRDPSQSISETPGPNIGDLQSSVGAPNPAETTQEGAAGAPGGGLTAEQQRSFLFVEHLLDLFKELAGPELTSLFS